MKTFHEMMKEARALVLDHRDGARAILDSLDEREIEERLDKLAEEATLERVEQGKLETLEKHRTEARRGLNKTEIDLHAAAVRFDKVAAELGKTFDELEGLSLKARKLTAQAGLPEKGDFSKRSTAVRRALWNGAPNLAKRLSLGFAPGRGKQALAEVITKPKDGDS